MPPFKSRFAGHALGPGIVAASSFAVSDTLAKLVFASGGDVVTLALIRGIAGLGILFVYLRIGPPPRPGTPRSRAVALGLGVLFAIIIFCLFEAIERITVPVAVLTYFIYPLLTGIGGSLFGIERVAWRGAAAAVVAFLGLALMVGAYPQQLSVLGLGCAVLAAVCRAVFLLLARTELQDSDPRLTTWYSLLSSTALFAIGAVLTLNWQPPQTAVGWIAIAIVSASTACAILTLYMSTVRIGPFRTALIMNLEPLLVTILSAILLGELITPIQAVGGAVMLGALVAFQLWR